MIWLNSLVLNIIHSTVYDFVQENHPVRNYSNSLNSRLATLRKKNGLWTLKNEPFKISFSFHEHAPFTPSLSGLPPRLQHLFFRYTDIRVSTK